MQASVALKVQRFESIQPQFTHVLQKQPASALFQRLPFVYIEYVFTYATFSIFAFRDASQCVEVILSGLIRSNTYDAFIDFS